MSRGAALGEAPAGMHHLVRLAFLAVGDFPFQQLSDGRAILVLMQAEHPARRHCGTRGSSKNSRSMNSSRPALSRARADSMRERPR